MNMNGNFYFDWEQLKMNQEANCGRPYQQCSITVMDTIADPGITFDNQRISNYYYEYKKMAEELPVSQAEQEDRIGKMIDKIKSEGKGKPYDCITGVSGGVDSSYLMLLAKRWGLRPLIVHFDNGWNSE